MHAPAQSLPKRLTDWHEGRAAVRMLVAALAAYICTTVIHIPGPYSAVITTLIVARPHSGGVLRASYERLIATILGAGIACAATFGRLIHVPELLLIGLTLAPLALVAAHNSAFRTSMVAAIIVLSAPAASGAPLHVAGARMLGVTLGAMIGALVSITVLPSRREVVVARAVAKLLGDFPELLRNAVHAVDSTDAQTRDRFEYRIRQALRELGLLIRDRPDALPSKGPAAAMVKFTVQIHADLVFLKRELQANQLPDGGQLPTPVRDSLDNVVRAFAGVANNVAALARGRDRAEHPDMPPLWENISAAAKALREECPNSEGARLMLRRLAEDLTALVRSMERALGPGSPLAPREA